MGETCSVKTHDVSEGSFPHSRDRTLKRANFLLVSPAVETHLTSVKKKKVSKFKMYLKIHNSMAQSIPI